MKRLTADQELLIELVWLLSQNSGIDLKTVRTMILKPMKDRKGKNCLECLEADGKAFINELITYLNEMR